jgi:hypothetical protein
MSGQDLFNELRAKQHLLETSLGELGKRGRESANAEQTYRVALAKKILEERDKGVPVTIISDICRGDREIARLKFERDVAEVSYSAAMEAINIYKLAIRTLDEQIGREWHRA